MNLQQLYNQADKGSYYSHTNDSDDIWLALTNAARRLYLWVVKENRTYFVLWDTTTIAPSAGVAEYKCPAALSQIIRLAEQTAPLVAGNPYRWMRPAKIESQTFFDNQFEGAITNMNSPMSDYCYAGPYLDLADAQDLGDGDTAGDANMADVYKIRIAPTPQTSLVTELIYVAKFVEIVNAKSQNIIPPEGHGLMLHYAQAELLRNNNDDLAEKLEAQANAEREEFLTFIRDRQFQTFEPQEPYLNDLD